MTDIEAITKKLQLKDLSQPLLIINAPKEYGTFIEGIQSEVHQQPLNDSYSFIQIFGTSNEDIQVAAKQSLVLANEDTLVWLCYPKKTSKKYKGLNCHRDTVAELLAAENYEPVRQIAIDEDWSALRFKPVGKIKTMTRKKVVTEQGKKRVER